MSKIDVIATIFIKSLYHFIYEVITIFDNSQLQVVFLSFFSLNFTLIIVIEK